MTRGELEKLEELFKMAYTNKVYDDVKTNVIEKGIDDIEDVKVVTGAYVCTLRIDLLDKALLKELLIRYVDTLKRKKAEAVEAFKNINVELPEGFAAKFGHPHDMPNAF